ncbi:MAG: TraR/DksA family transcriptional regulator, partial [Flavobacteriales bacterium]
GRISRMDAINNKSINDAALRQARNKLDKLQLAHQKCDDPAFGICIKCKGPIPMGRLTLMPESLRCVRCA